MNKTKNKTKALKSTENNGSGFFRALLLGLLTCAVSWIVLTFVFAFVMSRQEDSGAMGNILSPAVVVISLLLGGFAAGKCDKSYAALSSFVLGTVALGISYALSSALDLSRNIGPVMKTIIIAVMLVCPVIGSGLATHEKKKKSRHRKRM